MWDRLRSTAGGGGGGGMTSHGNHQGYSSSRSRQQAHIFASSTSTPGYPASGLPSSSSRQPRSSLIAARQPQQRQASADTENPYNFTGKPGPPPPRPPREFNVPPADLPQRSQTALLPPTDLSQRSQTTLLPPADLSQRSQTALLPPADLSQRSQTVPLPSYSQQNTYRDSTGRPTSSVYSLPPPLNTDFNSMRSNNATSRYVTSPDDVSPPSSPELLTPGHVPNHDISPIDEEDDFIYPPRPRDNTDMTENITARAMLPSQQRAASRQDDALPSHQRGPSQQDDALPSHQRAPSQQDDALPTQQRASSRQGDAPRPNSRSNIPMRRRERRQQKDAEAAATRVRSSGHDGSQDGTIPTPPRGPNQIQATSNKERIGQPATSGRMPRVMGSRERLRAPIQQERSVKPTDKPRGQKDPRWDPMTGEITNSSKGRPSQVKPVEFARGLGISTKSSTSPPSSPEQVRSESRDGRTGTSDGATSQASQIPKSDTDPAATAFISNRPGWRGASGRTAIVDPVQDNTEVAPLKIPPKSAKRPSQKPENTSGSGDAGGGGGGGDDIAMTSPPISPETRSTQIGGGGSAGLGLQGVVISSGNAGVGTNGKSSRMASTLSALNTIRKIIPSRSGNGNSSPSPNSLTIQGYPSPPLSGSLTPTARNISTGNAGGIGSLNGNNTLDANASGASGTAKTGANATAQSHPSLSAVTPSSSSSPTTANNVNDKPRSPSGQQQTIRRKEIGSQPPSTHLNVNTSHNHKAHDSFSSSVYSHTSEDNGSNTNPEYSVQPPHPRSSSNPIQLNTKDLPNLPGRGNAESPYVQPPSRFSITTYATSANTSSPRESIDVNAPPLPTPPKDIVMGLPQAQASPTSFDSLDNGDSILSRSRPKLRTGENAWDESGEGNAPIKISLTKAWMSTAGANSAGIDALNSPPREERPNSDTPKGHRDLPSHDRDTNRENSNRGGGLLAMFTSQRSPTSVNHPNSNSRPASILSIDKALPLAPPEVSTTGRIEQLNVHLSSLGNRRININRAIEQMTKLMPQDNLMATDAVRRKREVEKHKIDELERELADIQREEHELGMKLHRAYKKLDSQTEYEPTTLWVRRAAR